MARDKRTKRWADQIERDTTGTFDALAVSDITDLSARLANLTDSEVQKLEAVGAAAEETVTVVSSIEAGGGGAIGIQYKTRDITFAGGIATVVSAESSFTAI